MKSLSKDEFDAIVAEHEKWRRNRNEGRRAEFFEYELVGLVLPYYCTVIDCTVSGGTVSYCKVSDCTVIDCTVSYCKVSDCTVIGCTVSGGTVSYCKVSGGTVSYCKVSDCTVSDCTVSYCKVSDCTVSYCKVSRGSVNNKPFITLKGYEGLYRYNIWAVLFEDGSRWVRMGCLFKSLEDWEKEGGIRDSNLSDFPNDGSEKSEERVRAFEFAKAAALAMKMPEEDASVKP